jgi:acetylornithine/N-succinyldiaminopimelate aminotransferase
MAGNLTVIASILPTYNRADLVFERGDGAWLYTADGNAYLDFAGGIAVNGLGHAHPALVGALKQQADKLWHTSNLYRIEGQERLAQRLVDHSFADTVFFANSGAEAVECAIKMARRYHFHTNAPARYRVITFEGAFHGRTLATIAAGGQKKHLDGFGPKVDGFDQVPFADMAAVKETITDETAAVLLEPIQGEGGIRAFSHDMLRRLRTFCDDNNLLLIFDEVQCGMGRTGKLFAHEWSGVVPDIMAIAKSLGGGFPIGACLANAKAACGMTAGSHGSTFGGNPLAMAVANAVLDVMLAPGFFATVQNRALHLRQKLAGISDECPEVFAELRGEGLMLGLKCKVARNEKLLLVTAGDNVVRVLPPLIVGEEELKEGCARIARAAHSLRGAAHGPTTEREAAT